MKKLVIAASFILIVIISCTEEDGKYASDGVITGIDNRECVCCGGYFIDISDSTYRFFNLPPGSNFNLQNQIFPLKVKLDWKASADRCLGDEIDIIRIALH